MTERKDPKDLLPPGRKTVRDAEVDSKIEEAAAIGASVEEIAFYAGVHRQTLYRWMADDPKLRDRIIELQERPILKARQTVVQSLDDPNHAMRYLEKKRRAEFGVKAEVEVSGTLKTEASISDAATQRAIKAFEDAMRPELTAPLIPLPAPETAEAPKEAV